MDLDLVDLDLFNFSTNCTRICSKDNNVLSRKFSYKEELQRFQRTNPLLLACVAGTISKCKVRIDLLFSIV